MTNEELIDAFYDSGPTAELSCHRQELLRRLGAAVSASPQPHCPECGNTDLRWSNGRTILFCYNGKPYPEHSFNVSTVESFWKFFAPAPAQEPRCEYIFRNIGTGLRCDKKRGHDGDHPASNHIPCFGGLEPVAEPASTGEPHDSGCIFLSSRGIESCNCRAALAQYNPNLSNRERWEIENAAPSPTPSVSTEPPSALQPKQYSVLKGRRNINPVIDDEPMNRTHPIQRAPSVAGTQPTPDEEYEYPPQIQNIHDRCEANVINFSNDDVSELLVEIKRLAKNHCGAAQGTPQVEEVSREIANSVIGPLLHAAKQEGKISTNFLDEVAIETAAILRKHLVGAPAQPGPEEKRS